MTVDITIIGLGLGLGLGVYAFFICDTKLVMEDNKNLVFYNVDSDSNILIVRRLRGNARTRATALLIN